jgi:hypothetical protein
MAVIGNPVLHVRVSADAPVAKLAVRLEEVAPDGRSWMVSAGLLNLTHRLSHEQPQPLEPGRSYDVDVPLVFMSKRIAAGNRLRVALAENFWPLVWPSPAIATLTMTTGLSSLTLPVRPPETDEQPPGVEVLRNRVRDRALVNARGGLEATRSGPDAHGLVRINKTFAPLAATIPDVGTVVTRGWTPAAFEMKAGDPNSCRWSGGFSTRFQRAAWDATIRGGFDLTSSAENFHLQEFVEALEGDTIVFERHWVHDVKRDLM